MNKAVFLDRDGVVNKLIYHKEAGVIESPFNASQFKLLPGVAEAIKIINSLNMKAVIVSNQPGIAYGNFTKRTLQEIDKKMINLLRRENAFLDDIFYCLHHPKVDSSKYRKICGCRKPKAGLLYRAARKYHVDLKHSYMIGDNLTDVAAGNKAGCVTFLLGNMKCIVCKHIEDTGIKPNYVVKDLFKAIKIIKQIEHKTGI